MQRAQLEGVAFLSVPNLLPQERPQGAPVPTAAARLHHERVQHAWLPVFWPSEREARRFFHLAFLPFFSSPLWPFLPPSFPALAFPANPVKVIMIESGNIALGDEGGREGREGGKEGEFAAHPPEIPVYLLDTDTKM